MDQYDTAEEYYSTLFHELTHSTGAEGRCGRDIKKSVSFGSEEYSREELVAEIGSAMMLNYIGIEAQSTFKNSVAYLQCWLRALKNDPKMIVYAAGKAEKAVRYMLNEKTK